VNPLHRFRKSTIWRALRVLDRRDHFLIGALSIVQVGLSFLDLLGVAAIGMLGALSVSGIQSGTPGNRVSSALRLLHIDGFTFQQQIAILGIIATTLLVGRTLISIFFTRRSLHFLSRRGAVISAQLISKLLSQSLLSIQSRSSQMTLHSVTAGVSMITLGILAPMILLISDISLLLVMAVGLLLIDPLMALGTFGTFGATGLLIYLLLNKRAHSLGVRHSRLDIASSEKILEVLDSYREIMVRNRRQFYVRKIGNIRMELAETQAEMSFMPNISKYVIETTVVLGGLIVGATQFMRQDATHAVATLSVFLAAVARIAPAVLRIQQGVLQLKTNVGAATPTFELIDEINGLSALPEIKDEVDISHINFIPNVKVENISFAYPGQIENVVTDISLEVPPGAFLAIVGSSGAGKTTLIDLLLGIITPKIGKISISNKAPLASIASWPGAIGYVPQDVQIADGTIRENISLGFPEELATDSLIWDAIKIAQLDEFVKSLPNGIDTKVGEHGAKLSGGQRQRLGIARAMFTKPRLLVLDEATSSLDGETEANIADAIRKFKGEVTVIMIAHRLSTVRTADNIVYLERGRIAAQGTFAQVRAKVPDFDRQAQLMGL
jgi:ABC-type multidrug transport system fused ATPase/permease subunit